MAPGKQTSREAEASHDNALLQHCRDRHTKLNSDYSRKIKFKMASLTYMGHVFSANGLAPDPEKI